MKRLVVGTAGHIDHGKTALVRALTGIDTDRLKEEKLRGITIELGFAPLELPDGQRLAFIDVPGHERFVRHMIAGASGIDAVLLVIAADEGVMPQTREHLDILELLGVTHGAVVLTKIDLVDEELLELAVEDVREFIQDTFLEKAPLLPCSSVSLEGLGPLLETLQHFGRQLEQRSGDGLFRLPIDRVFTRRGFGSVVTGTVLSGTAHVGDTLELLPSEKRARVRGLQVHGEEVRAVMAGQRAAVNVQGLDRSEIGRGEQLTSPNVLTPTYILDVAYRQLASLEQLLSHRARVRFLNGTSEINGVAHVLGSDALEPGEHGYLQLRLDQPVPARGGDRFVLRLESPVITLGGGVVLDTHPTKHRRHGRAAAAEVLKTLHRGDLKARVGAWLVLSGPGGLSVEALARRSGEPIAALKTALLAAVARGQAVSLDLEGREYISLAVLKACRGSIIGRLEAFHASDPLKPGAPRGALRSSQTFFADSVFRHALQTLVTDGQAIQEGPLYRLSTFEVQLSAEIQKVADRLQARFIQAALSPPLMTELKETLHPDEGLLVDLLQHLTRIGVLEKIKEGHWISRRALETLQTRLIAYLQENGELTPTAFKELTGLSRKWAIPLLEYFDRTRVTLRVGDVRRLRGA